MIQAEALITIFTASLITGMIPGPGGPCPNCPTGWWCCGESDQCFNSTTYLCCDNNVAPGCGENSRCCGSSCYDPEAHICCGGDTVHQKCGENSWCCNKQCYDPDRQHCCGGEVFTCPPGFICCGRGCYDPNSRLCCDGNILEKCGDETACCGDRCYDVIKERCDLDHGGMRRSNRNCISCIVY